MDNKVSTQNFKMNLETVLPSIELVSERVHEAWIKSKLALGVTTRQSETGEELMVPYLDLSEAAKDLDRNSVKAVYKAILND